MSTIVETKQSPARSRPKRRSTAALTKYLVTIVVSCVSPVALTTTVAHACACGCSVFDVGGLDLPQEQDHGGRVFFDFGALIRRRIMSVAPKPRRLSIQTSKSIPSGTTSASATISIAIGA